MSQLSYQRFHAATTVIREEPGWPTPKPAEGVCACCGRGLAHVEDPGVGIPYQYDTSQAELMLCTTCYTPKQASEKALGAEQYRPKSGTYVYGKLGMLPGSGGVITADNVLHLALPPGFVKKFQDGYFGQQGQIHQKWPLSLLTHLHGSGQLGDVSDGIVFIGVFGRKSLSLMGNLKETTDLRETWVNGDDGSRPTNIGNLLAIASWLRNNGLESQGCKRSFWTPIEDAAKGRHDADKLARWAEKVPEPQQLLDLLPTDPADRIGLHLAMSQILSE